MIINPGFSQLQSKKLLNLRQNNYQKPKTIYSSPLQLAKPPKNYFAPIIRFGSAEGENYRKDIQKFFNEIKNIDIYETEPYKDSAPLNTPEAKKAIKKFKILDNPSKEQKKIFIEEYCKETGWPSLLKSSDKIIKHLNSVINDSAKGAGVKPIVAGYDRACSLAKYDAIPGSDADRLFVILESCDKEKKKNFESLMRKKSNRIIMSYSIKHPVNILTIDELKKYTEITNNAYNKMTEDLSPTEKIKQEKHFEDTVYTENDDYLKAGEFNLKLKKFLPKDINLNELRDVCFTNEVLRDGILLFDNMKPKDKEFIKNSPLYKYSNMSQQLGKKGTVKIKTRMRKKMAEQFNSLNVDEQFEYTKIMFLSGFDCRPPKGSKYGDCFHNFGDKTPYGESQNSSQLKKEFLSR